MSNPLIFDILPFNPLIIGDVEIPLPIDLDDFVRQLQIKLPAGEIRVSKSEGRTSIVVAIPTERHSQWVIARYIESHSDFSVSGYPKRIAKEIIMWYRGYIPSQYPLFLVIADSGYVTELKPSLSLDDLEIIYRPYTVPDE